MLAISFGGVVLAAAIVIGVCGLIYGAYKLYKAMKENKLVP